MIPTTVFTLFELGTYIFYLKIKRRFLLVILKPRSPHVFLVFTYVVENITKSIKNVLSEMFTLHCTKYEIFH